MDVNRGIMCVFFFNTLVNEEGSSAILKMVKGKRRKRAFGGAQNLLPAPSFGFPFIFFLELFSPIALKSQSNNRKKKKGKKNKIEMKRERKRRGPKKKKKNNEKGEIWERVKRKRKKKLMGFESFSWRTLNGFWGPPKAPTVATSLSSSSPSSPSLFTYFISFYFIFGLSDLLSLGFGGAAVVDSYLPEKRHRFTLLSPFFLVIIIIIIIIKRLFYFLHVNHCSLFCISSFIFKLIN